MSNLFKKGFASVALASAMASGVFAGNAAYIDVKVNYLSGMGKAVLGYDDVNETTNKRLDEVELLVSVLDKDGNYATKSFNGADSIPTVDLSGEASGATFISTGVVKRALKGGNSIQRFVIDYSLAEVSKLMDEVTLTSGSGSGKIERIVGIELATRVARGLIVRATPNYTFKTEKYINEEFNNLDILSETTKLGEQSSTSPGGIAGVVIPLQVYASTKGNQDSSTGRFTLASELEGKTIVVQALADYNDDGYPRVVLNSVELNPMVNGQASGEITINNAMPAGAFGKTIAVTQRYGADNDGGGLGIVFIAYVKEQQSINTYIDINTDQIRDNTVMADYNFNASMTSLNKSSDTIQVRSGEAAELKVGTFDSTQTKLSKLWAATVEVFTVSEGIEVSPELDGNIASVTNRENITKTLTVVDSYGNPAIGKNTSVSIKIDDEAQANNTQFVRNVTGNIAVGSNGVTEVIISATDSADTKNTLGIKSQKLTVNASTGVLSNVKAKDLTIRTLPLIEVTKNGGPTWIDTIVDVRTSDDFALVDVVNNNFLGATTPNKAKKATDNDFTVVIKSGINDPKLDDGNATFRLYIKDKSGEGVYLESGDLRKFDFNIVGNSNLTGVAGLFYEDDVVVDAINADGKDEAGEGYWRFDINSSGSDDFNITIGKNGGTSRLVTIAIENFNSAEIKEQEIAINIPAYEDKYTAAYVDVYMENVGDDLKEIPVGSIVNFKFTGSAVSTGDAVTIDMSSTGFDFSTNGKSNTVARIGLVGSDIASNTDGMITTTLPENHIVSVVLYDADADDVGSYGFNQTTTNNAVTINGMRPVWLNLRDDDDTGDVYDLAIGDSINTLRSKKDAISQIRVSFPNTPARNGDGSEEDKARAFGIDLGFMYDGMFNGVANTVKTGLVYTLFNAETDVVLLDKYNNEIVDLKEDIGKDVEYTTTDGMEFKNNGSENSWVKFKDEAAGTKQTLTLTRTKADGTKITKTITWTNIKLSKLNTKFMVTTDSNGPTDPNTGAFDVVNSEVIVKVIGDGNTKQSDTIVKVVHSDSTATVRFVKVSGLKTQNLYTNALVGANSSTGDVIQIIGTYYILSSDKTGTVTITATAKGKDSKGADITVSGTHTVTFDAIDLNKPIIDPSDVIVANGKVSVTIQDANLDTVRSTVIVKNSNGKKIADGVYADGKFTAKVSSAGTYLVDVIAIDMAGNVQLDDDGKPQPFEFVRIAGAGAPTVEEEAAATLIAKKEYTVAGTFTSHNFGSDKAKNWIYTKKSDGMSYQLLGETPSDKDIFGWKEVEVKAGTENVWYMIKTGDSRFDWALANADGIAYKLKGAKSDGSFDFSGRLNLNVSHKDGMLTFTAKK